MNFKVKTDAFEGPLDLLLDLIEKRKLFINDISLAQVTDDFIEHVKIRGEMPMGESAHFILIASTLLLIKSKSLLPGLKLTEEEQGNIEDLELRLKIYAKIRETSKGIRSIFGKEMIYEPSAARPIDPLFTPDPSFNLVKILSTVKDLVNKFPKKEKLESVMVKKVISIEEMIDTLSVRITSHLRMSFKEFTKEHRGNRVNIIVSFLAMLELVKQGAVHVSQDNTFGDINMETKEIGVPTYR